MKQYIDMAYYRISPRAYRPYLASRLFRERVMRMTVEREMNAELRGDPEGFRENDPLGR